MSRCAQLPRSIAGIVDVKRYDIELKNCMIVAVHNKSYCAVRGPWPPVRILSNAATCVSGWPPQLASGGVPGAGLACVGFAARACARLARDRCGINSGPSTRRTRCHAVHRR